jgi:hypothetical protein
LLEVWKFGSLEGFTWEADAVRAWDSLDSFFTERTEIRIEPEVSPMTSKLPNFPFTQQHHRTIAMARGATGGPQPGQDWKARRCGRRGARLIAGSLEVWKALPGKRALFGLGTLWILFYGEDGDPDRARGLSNDSQTSKLPVHPAASSSHRDGPRPPPAVALSPDWKPRRCGPAAHRVGVAADVSITTCAGARPSASAFSVSRPGAPGRARTMASTRPL